VSIFTRVANAIFPTKKPPHGQEPQYLTVADLAPMAYGGQVASDPFNHSLFDGGKFDGGFGPTQLYSLDYWTLRARSSQLFNENLYARGLIRRLVTNEVNTGLTPECTPDEVVLGLKDGALEDWTELTENRFGLWGKSPLVCDWLQKSTFGAIQRAARMEALVAGDVLVVLRYSQRTRLPCVQLVKGDAVQSPLGGSADLRKSHTVRHGVEFDVQGREVAYWVRQDDGATVRMPAWGEKSGRRLAWLVFGTEKRLDEVRGMPLLSLVLQSLKEVDRYRDSTQRKAATNSLIAGFIKKGEDKPSSLPVTGGAVRRGQATVSDETTGSTPRKVTVGVGLPGMYFEELQTGEEPVLLGGQGTDTNFGAFEEVILQAVAWANEVPPEILCLAFSNNYSASQAALNEFKIYLNKIRDSFGEEFCSPVFEEWLFSETLLGKCDAPSLRSAWFDAMQHDIVAAWVSCEWNGPIKPTTDPLKQVKAADLYVKSAYSTHAREARATTGTKWSKNVKRVATENAQLAAAMRPLLELQKEFGPAAADAAVAAMGDLVDRIEAMSQVEEA